MSLLFLAANIINSIEMWGTFTCVFSALFRIPKRPQNKCHKNGERTREALEESERWPLMFQDEENPMSGDSAGLYINRVINRSIAHSEGDSCHMRRQTSNTGADT